MSVKLISLPQAEHSAEIKREPVINLQLWSTGCNFMISKFHFKTATETTKFIILTKHQVSTKKKTVYKISYYSKISC